MPSRWFNLGAWTGARSYDDACAALARRLADAAALGTGQRVLDVGAGAAQQSALFLDERGVARVDALEPDPRARAAAPARDGLHLHAGDAADLGAFADADFDRVVSLDAAYHFSSRSRFLDEARRVLRPGGHLAVVDLALARRPRRAERWLARLAGVAPANLWTLDEVEPALSRAGLVDVRVTVLDDVLEGFARFSTSSPGALRAFPVRRWPKVVATGAGLRALRHPVCAILYVATAPPRPAPAART